MKNKIKYPKILPLVTDNHCYVMSTGMSVPENVVTNDDILSNYDIRATDRSIQFGLGAVERRWDNQGLNSSDLLFEVSMQCLEKANIAPDQLDRIIYARLLGDDLVPKTSIRVMEKLRIKKGIPTIDIRAACSGFIHALDMAIRYINAGESYVLVLAGGIASRSANNSNKKDSKTIFLMGDGASGVLLGPSEKKHFFASYIYSDNSLYEEAYVPFGSQLLNGDRNFNNEIFNMNMQNGINIHNATIKSAYVVTQKLLETTNLTIDDVDAVVTSDQTKLIWEEQLKTINAPKEKSMSMFPSFGNTVSAMTPINFHEMISTNKIKRGNTVLMMAHGAGASGGGLIFQY